MRKAMLVVLMVAALAVLAPASLAQGPWRVEAMQFGAPVAQVNVGASFEVVGSGFHARVLPVKVCVDGRSCTLANVDQRGSFFETRSMLTPGMHTIEVFQAESAQLKGWRLRASAMLSVVE